MRLDEIIGRLSLLRCVTCERPTAKGVCGACAARGALNQTTGGGLPVYALGQYEGLLAELVRALKYEESTTWCGVLGTLLPRMLPFSLKDATLVPVPLHPVRLAERGYNQSALLARGVARTAGARIDFELLAKERETKAQAQLDRIERRNNLSDAFRASATQSGRTLVLVDDVITTGTTIDACAATLSAQGHSVLCALGVAFSSAETDERDPLNQREAKIP